MYDEKAAVQSRKKNSNPIKCFDLRVSPLGAIKYLGYGKGE